MSFGGTNLDQGHAYNRRLILEAIRVHGALSRADLTRLTGLAPQTISNLSATLAEAGLVVAERRSGSGRGQPPTDLRLNPRGGYAFGVSIDNRRLFTVLLDIAGNRLNESECHLKDTSPEAVLRRIASAIAALRRETSLPDERVLGAGIAMTGLTTHGSFIGLAPDEITSRWHGFPLESELEATLGMPIFTDNDARAAAVGEAFYGTGRKYRDFVYIYFGRRRRRQHLERGSALSRQPRARGRVRPHDGRGGWKVVLMRQSRLPRAICVDGFGAAGDRASGR